MDQTRILLIEDDAAFRSSLADMVRRLQFDVVEADSVATARTALASAPPDIVLMDLDLPDGNGLDLRLDEGVTAQTPFIVISGDASSQSAERALGMGATDYLPKPVDPIQLRNALQALEKGSGLRREIAQLTSELSQAGRFGPLVGRSGSMQRTYDFISRVAPTTAPVLVTGESGSGKEVVAHTIHQRSGRADAPFIALNCGAMPEALIESQLFGHQKGAFTGATESKKGVFEEADGGTLFLDEIGEMPMDLQVRLLRVLETQEVNPVGSTRTVKVDVRVVAATNRNPQDAIAAGKMREDLFFRLSVFPIALPPLRDRGDDVLLLADHFLDELNAKHGITKFFARDARPRLLAADWPGNVRQLRNAIERAWILTDSELSGTDLEEAARAGARNEPHAEPDPHADAALTTATPVAEAPTAGQGEVRIAVGTSAADAERILIEATLEACDGNKRKASRVLGVSVKTLYNRLNDYEQAATAPTE